MILICLPKVLQNLGIVVICRRLQTYTYVKDNGFPFRLSELTKGTLNNVLMYIYTPELEVLLQDAQQ